MRPGFCGEEEGLRSIQRWKWKKWFLVCLCMYVRRRRYALRWMSQYQTFPKNKKLNCWLLMGILMLDNLSCLKEVCISLCFIVCVILRWYQCICWSKICRKRNISTWIMRRESEWNTVGRSTGGMFLKMVSIIVRFMSWGGIYKQERRRIW